MINIKQLKKIFYNWDQVKDFLNEYETVYKADKYTIDNKPTVPSVPEKAGYTGEWEEIVYTYDKDNAVIG